MPGVAHRGRGRRAVNEINMVPFIDVMLVLLIIFMVTAPMITPSLIDLPSVGKANKQPDKVLQVVIQKDESLELLADGKTSKLMIGGVAEAVKNAPADGYTLLLATSSTHSIAPTLNPKLNYDPDGDFTPIAHVANAPNVVLVPLSSPAKNIEQFVALAKSKPGALNYASSGNGTVVHLQTELFKSMSGTFITHIPYRGTALAIPDLISGKIDLLIDSIPSALPHIHGGKVRALAVTSRQRTALMGDLPTVAETLKGYEAVTWFGLFAPKHLSPELTARINTAINEALAEPELRAQLNRLGAEAVGGTPQAFATHYRREREQWKKVIAERKITAE